MDVSQKVALVTGGGRGIGRGIVLALARNGADVAVADINAGEDTAAAAEVEALGRRSLGVAVDVTDVRSVGDMVSRVIDTFGRIDILVNNAGIVGAPGWENRERSNEEDWDQIYDVNVKGIVRVTEAVAPHMIQRRYGKIVNVASGAARVGDPGNPPYNVSKAGVISYTQTSAMELAAHSINVNSICPGLLWTPMLERIATHVSLTSENAEGLSPRQWFERRVADRIPLKREQTPEDIGNLATFLASDHARNITGQAINVNGGLRMD
jgi:meso-butanediol dehydrogenase/(S,S)-butanediol dehydrogenase/diacetyl reductase